MWTCVLLICQPLVSVFRVLFYSKWPFLFFLFSLLSEVIRELYMLPVLTYNRIPQFFWRGAGSSNSIFVNVWKSTKYPVAFCVSSVYQILLLESNLLYADTSIVELWVACKQNWTNYGCNSANAKGSPILLLFVKCGFICLCKLVEGWIFAFTDVYIPDISPSLSSLLHICSILLLVFPYLLKTFLCPYPVLGHYWFLV